jgi:hydroxymethylpyrimidine pyrophosphatase-like HAD family hydrolase
MTRIELVVSDLDGTPWDLDHSLHPRTRDAIAELERRGIPLLIATGRRQQRTAGPLAAFGLAPPAILLNGAVGVHLATGERFHSATIGAEAATGVLAAFRAAGVEPVVYVDRPDVAAYVGRSPSTHPEHLTSFGPDVGVDDLDRVVAEEGVFAFAVLGVDREPLDAIAAAIGAHGIPHIGPDRGYGGWTITVAGPAMSKWLGVERYCELHDIDAGAVLAIGDGPNDLELFAGAAVSVAMGDSDAALLAVADHVVGLAGDGAWADLLAFL